MARADRTEEGWRVVCSDGEVERVSGIDWDISISATLQATFPAFPGTSALLRVEEDEGPDTIHRSTVLAWGIYADGETRPITLDAEASAPYFIEFADGHVESSRSLDRWPNAQAWLDDRQKP